MRCALYVTNLFCSDECLHGQFEDVDASLIEHATLPRGDRNKVLAALLERATCDGCGLNLLDLARAAGRS